MRKKYELIDKTKTLADGTVLRRIRAVRDFVLADGTTVHEGDLGGWVEREDNLSQDGSAWVFGEALACGNARVFGNAWVGGKALVCDRAKVFENAWVHGKARVFGNAQVGGKAWVCDEAWVYEEAYVGGCAKVCGNAQIKSINDYAVFKNTWSSGRWFTYTSSNGKWKVGCFYGMGEELVAKAYRDSKLSGRCYEAIVRAQEAVDKAIEDAK